MIVTWFVSVTTFVVAGMWLLSRWIVRALAAPEFFDSYKTIGLVSTGVMLYALYLVLVIVLGRTGRTEFNFPATAAGTVVNIVLNLVLLPSMGIVGAGISLVASYAVVLVLMYVFTQRLFPVPYEWLRLGQAVGLAALLVLAGELLLPTSGIGGLAGRTGCLARLSAAALGYRLPQRRGAGGGRASAQPRLRQGFSPAPARGTARRSRSGHRDAGGAKVRTRPAPAPDARGAGGGAARRGRDPLAAARPPAPGIPDGCGGGRLWPRPSAKPSLLQDGGHIAAWRLTSCFAAASRAAGLGVGILSASSMAGRSASGSCGSTSTPASGVTNSGGPPVLVASTVRSIAIASRVA